MSKDAQGRGTAGPQQRLPSSLSGSRRPSHVLLRSPTGLLLLLLRSFNKDKRDESLLAENWGRGETRAREPMGRQSDASLASSQLSRLCAWRQGRCRSDQRNPRSGALDAQNTVHALPKS